jgi:hypothetical protein
MFLEFLMCDGSIEASYLQDILYDLEGLFDLLEVAQNEWKAPEYEYSGMVCTRDSANHLY